MQREHVRNPRRRSTDKAARKPLFQSVREHRKQLRGVAERNLLHRFPSLKGKRVLRAISNFETTPHLNEVERARALLGAYHRAFDVVESAAERARVAKRIAEIAILLDVTIRTLHGYGTRGTRSLESMGVFTRRRSPR